MDWTTKQIVLQKYEFNENERNITFLARELRIYFYSKSYDYVPLPLPSRYRFGPYVTDRYRFRANVTHRDINVTDRY